MKQKTIVSFDEETVNGVRELIISGLFRNKSYVIEYSIKRLIEEVKNA